MKTLKLTNPLFAPVALPYSTGPLAAPERHQQPEQRHYAAAVTQATVDDLYAAVGTAYAVYQASRVATDALDASTSDLEWRAAWDARERALTAWLGAQRVWSTALLAHHDVSLPLAPDGPRAQPEQRHMARAMCGEVRSRVGVEQYTQPEQQQAQLMVVAPEWEVPMLALNLPTDRAANDALFEAADERARDLLRQELRARERGDWAESERLFTEHRTETAYMAALTAVLPGADWLDA